MRVVPETADAKADALTLAVHCLLAPVGMSKFVEPVPSSESIWEPPDERDDSLLAKRRDLCASPDVEKIPVDLES
jgi:hypothetical protein